MDEETKQRIAVLEANNRALDRECEMLRRRHAEMRAALLAIRDYVDSPAAVGAQGMTDAEKIGGMWSQAVAALPH